MVPFCPSNLNYYRILYKRPNALLSLILDFGVDRRRSFASDTFPIMGWVWKNEDGDVDFPLGDDRKLGNFNPNVSGDQCSIRKVVGSRCKTEEVAPGKFVRKCEKTEEIFRDCLGRPVEVIESTKEYTEEDVTDVMNKGSFSMGSAEEGGRFDFPGLRSDIEAIERNFSGRFDRFFEAAEEMKNGFFDILRDPHIFDGEPSSSSPSTRTKIPVEDQSQKVFPKQNECDSGFINISGLAREV